MLRIALLCLLVSSSLPALAIYRCEAGGKVSYSDQPCANGRLVDIKAEDAPRDAGKAAAALSQDKARLRELESDRRRREDKEESERKAVARANFAKRNRCRVLEQRKNWATEDVATASGRTQEKAKRKMRRVSEQFEGECGGPMAL